MRILLLLVGLLTALPLPAAEPDLKPAQTYAVIAGVLQWPGSRISGFPTKNRKDEELFDVLKSRGVPAENMKLLLDEEATFSGIKRAITAVAGKAPAGSTFIFYYCGHGMPIGKNRELCMANYDLIPQRADTTGLLASDLAAMVKANFRGQRVLFLADCCFSGGLGATAKILHDAGFETAAITSSNDQVISTVNWTFTQTVIDTLRGDPFADGNGDGFVTIAELNAEVNAAMGALERQPSGYAAYGWKGEFTLAPAKSKAKAAAGTYKPGDYVVAGNMRAGRVLDGAEGKYAVQFYDYTEKRRVEIPEENLKPLPAGWQERKPMAIEKAEFEVEWKGQWFPARMLKKDGEKTLIRYIGYESNFDEWVTKERMRPLSTK